MMCRLHKLKVYITLFLMSPTHRIYNTKTDKINIIISTSDVWFQCLVRIIVPIFVWARVLKTYSFVAHC